MRKYLKLIEWLAENEYDHSVEASSNVYVVSISKKYYEMMDDLNKSELENLSDRVQTFDPEWVRFIIYR